MSEQMTQQHQALAAANELRRQRKALLGRMSGMSNQDQRFFVADLIEDVPDVLSSMPVWKLLERVNRVGPERRDDILAAAGVTDIHKPLGQLTERQRVALVSIMRLRSLGWRSISQARLDKF